MATVLDILNKVDEINKYIDVLECDKIDPEDYDDVADILKEYRDELLDKKVVK